MTSQPDHDAFSPPRDIPDASAPHDHPAATSAADGDASLAPLPQAGGVGGGHRRRPQHNEFSRERRVRFLDMLALEGNVSCAANEAGVSRENAYRARRQDPEFAQLWDAALVHARPLAEEELAARAYGGVEVPIVHGGEVTGYKTVHDPRWLLAHLARLDRRIEHDAHAVARAERFDELLADYAGHPAPEGFFDAAREALDWRDRADAPALPPTRDEWIRHRAGAEIGNGPAKTEARRMAAAEAAAGAEWDDWHEGCAERVAGIVDPAPLPHAGGAGGGPGAGAAPDAPTPDPSREREGDFGVPTEPPLEYKSWPADTVTPVRGVALQPAPDTLPPAGSPL